MRYLMMVINDKDSQLVKDYEAGLPMDSRLQEAIGKHSEAMFKAGILLEVGGLLPESKGVRVRANSGKLVVTDGPFIESKELLGGYGILKADTRDEAIELGKTFLQIHVDILGPAYNGVLEIREMFDPPNMPCQQP
ncbi:YciI family protein [Anatilimnocola sp. NA78]|uniref:YciI family protein n=1 Tax=Anatilimnocola sp. NA78 TaxID=3415683 RepID=UPI003CE50861